MPLITFNHSSVNSNTASHFATKLATGKFRDVYAEGDHIFKISKAHQAIQSKGNLPCFLLHLQSFVEMLVWDVNKYEFNTYKAFIDRIPFTLRNSFSAILGVKRIRGTITSISQCIKNADGTRSISLKEFGPVSDAQFWSRLEQVKTFLLHEKILLLGISSENILVQHLSDGTTIPVFIDYKHFGGHTYPLQVWLMRKSACIRKMQRKFKAIETNFKVRKTQ